MIMQSAIDAFEKANSVPQPQRPFNGATWAIWTIVDFSEERKREVYRAINKMIRGNCEDD